MSRFCARCGATESKTNPILTYLCIDCYIREKGINLVPEIVTIKTCSRCGSIKFEGKWLTPDEYGNDVKVPISYHIQENIEKSSYFSEIEIEKLQIKEELGGYYIETTVTGKVLGRVFRKIYRSSLKITRTLCPTCLKAQGKSYDATVQIRGLPRLNRKLEDKLYNEIANNVPDIIRTFIAEIEIVRNGIDVKLTSKEAAYALADYIQRKYGGYRTYSDESIKRDRSGKTVSKKTISLRILSVEPGEYINIDGKPYIVDSVYRDRIVLIDRDGKKVSMSHSDIYKGWSKKK